MLFSWPRYNGTMDKKQVQVGTAVFIFKDGKFLMMKRRGSHGAGTWAPPGGKMEFGEAFEDTARREVKEEVGLDIADVRLVGVTNDLFPADEKHFITLWLTSSYAGGEPKIMEPEKCTAIEWRTFDDLPSPLFSTWDTLLVSDFVESIKQGAR